MRKHHYFASSFYGRPQRVKKHRRNKLSTMRGLLNLLSFLLTTGLFITGVFYFIAKILGRIVFDPASQAWKRTLEKLQTRLRAQAAGALVPWDDEMLSLLSLERKNVKKPGWWDSVSEGVFLSIYQEPVVAYAGQNAGNTAAYVAATSRQEFIFRQKEKETEIWVDRQPFAVYVSGNLLAAGRSSQLLARVEVDESAAQWPAYIADKPVAALNNPRRIASGTPNPRALTLLRKLNGEEEQILLALAMLTALKFGKG